MSCDTCKSCLYLLYPQKPQTIGGKAKPPTIKNTRSKNKHFIDWICCNSCNQWVILGLLK